MASVIKVDQIQSDTGTVNVSSNLQFSGSSSTLQVGKALYLANTNNFALQFQDDVAGRLRIASSYSTFGDNNPFIIERPSAGSAQNDAITIRAGGVVDLGKGQLKFPATQNASSDPNTLDDYEEGTFVPAYKGTSSDPTVVYNWRGGMYVKIGRLVYFWLALGVNTTSGGSGDLLVGGLPFVSQSGEEPQVGVAGSGGVHVTYGGWQGASSSYNIPISYLVDYNGTSFIRLYRTDASGTRGEMTGLGVNALTSGDRIFTSGVYLTNT